MAIEFPDNIFGFKVEQRVIPRPGGGKFMFNSHTQIGVLHTTENPSIDGSFKSLNQSHSAPHFIVGEGRIIQCRSLAHQGAALVGNGPVLRMRKRQFKLRWQRSRAVARIPRLPPTCGSQRLCAPAYRSDPRLLCKQWRLTFRSRCQPMTGKMTIRICPCHGPAVRPKESEEKDECASGKSRKR